MNDFQTLEDLRAEMQEARDDLYRAETRLTTALRDRELKKGEFHRRLDAFLLRQRILKEIR